MFCPVVKLFQTLADQQHRLNQEFQAESQTNKAMTKAPHGGVIRGRRRTLGCETLPGAGVVSLLPLTVLQGQNLTGGSNSQLYENKHPHPYSTR
ncbi:hypothetical protein AOLI_G00176730 [Acnodon oligacanthus]